MSAGGPYTDLDSLQPPPPPGADCKSSSASKVECDTFKDFDFDHEPLFDLSCGTVFETSREHRDGYRWYVDGKAVARHVLGHTDGIWTTGNGRVATLTANFNSRSIWQTPGDHSTVLETYHGDQYRLSARGVGTILAWTGRDDPEDGSAPRARDRLPR